MSGGQAVGELGGRGVSAQVGVEGVQGEEAPQLQLAEPLRTAAAAHVTHLQDGEYGLPSNLTHRLGLC